MLLLLLLLLILQFLLLLFLLKCIVMQHAPLFHLVGNARSGAGDSGTERDYFGAAPHVLRVDGLAWYHDAVSSSSDSLLFILK